MKFLTACMLLVTPLYAHPCLSYPFPLREETGALHEEASQVEARYDPSEIRQLLMRKAPRLEERLKKKVFGQDRAVEETASAVMRFAAGVNDPHSVVASLLFSGPSGVGKTELAKQLCLELYGNMHHFVRVNLSEFSEPHSISRLIGSPPGYIGYGEGGQLTNALLKNPYSIVLLDEIEKGHAQVLKLFLHVFDEGVFTSASGQLVDCRSAIFICTSNILSSEIAAFAAEGYNPDEIAELLRPYFISKLSPELFNRLTFIVFSPLTADVIEQMVARLLGELKERVEKTRGISLLFDESIIHYLADIGIDPELGARPLKRLIDKELATVLACALLDGSFDEGDVLKCSYAEGRVCIEFILRFEEDE